MSGSIIYIKTVEIEIVNLYEKISRGGVIVICHFSLYLWAQKIITTTIIANKVNVGNKMHSVSHKN